MNIQIDPVEPPRVQHVKHGMVRIFWELAEIHEEYEGWLKFEDVLKDLLQEDKLLLVCDFVHFIIYWCFN